VESTRLRSCDVLAIEDLQAPDRRSQRLARAVERVCNQRANKLGEPVLHCGHRAPCPRDARGTRPHDAHRWGKQSEDVPCRKRFGSYAGSALSLRRAGQGACRHAAGHSGPGAGYCQSIGGADPARPGPYPRQTSIVAAPSGGAAMQPVKICKVRSGRRGGSGREAVHRMHALYA
jgi:hypothetical protein